MLQDISLIAGQVAIPAGAAPLCREIKVLVEKAVCAVEKAQQFYTAAGQQIKALQKLFPDNWETLIKEHCGIGRSRAYEIVAIADGRSSIEEVRAGNAQRQKISREKKSESVTSRISAEHADFGSGEGGYKPGCKPTWILEQQEAPEIGAFLERIGADRFFAALQHAPKLKAAIERRVALHRRTDDVSEVPA
jgi:hypothetical protein